MTGPQVSRRYRAELREGRQPLLLDVAPSRRQPDPCSVCGFRRAPFGLADEACFRPAVRKPLCFECWLRLSAA